MKKEKLNKLDEFMKQDNWSFYPLFMEIMIAYLSTLPVIGSPGEKAADVWKLIVAFSKLMGEDYDSVMDAINSK